MISKLTRTKYRFCSPLNNLQLLLNKFSKTKTPYFKVQSHQIQIIKDPMDFYLRLYKLANSSYKRIGLSSLYLGTGTLERYLLEKIIKSLNTSPSLEIRMLFDYYRSNRVQKGQSGIEMMEHALMFAPKRVKAGYLTENYSPLLKLFSKGISQVMGVHHMKLYVFDDTTIITGANLSHSYFTRRQDRCIVIKDCQQLSNYFYDLINGLVNGSYLKLEPDNKIFGKQGDLSQYYKLWRFGSRKVSIEDQTSQQQYMRFDPKDLQKQKKLLPKKESKDLQLSNLIYQAKQNIRDKLQGANDQYQVSKLLSELNKVNQQKNELTQIGEAVYLFPTVQINSVHQNIQKQTIIQVLKYNIQNQNKIYISSGYMNLPQFIIDILIKTKSRLPIITSTPKANSFFQGGRFKKYIPHFYREYEHLLLTRSDKQNSSIEVIQYENNDWTFHTKGIWIQQSNTNNMLTVIGSSNYNMRSYQRDTQCQLYIYSTSQQLNQRFREQWNDLESKGQRVNKDIDQDQKLKITKNVKWMAKLFNRFL